MNLSSIRMMTWITIALCLAFGVALYWQSKGRAAETVNVAHTEALTASSLGLVGYWTLDGNDMKWSDTTTEVKDTSGNSKHGDAQGSLATTSVRAGRIGQALSFNGSSDVISLGNVYNGVKTVSFWAKPNSTTQPFIDLNGTATIDMTSGTVAANNFTSPTIYVDGAVTSTLSDTNWHHITITTGTGVNASATNIGKISTSYFGGTMDDIRFYSSGLSATQVTDLYRSSGAKEVDNAAHRDVLTNGLVGYWTFDGRDIKWSDTTTEIKDISGNANHGDAVGLTTASVIPGKLGQALSFNGTSDEIDFSGPTVTNTHTVSFWFKADPNISGSWNSLLGEADSVFVFYYDASYDKIRYFYGANPYTNTVFTRGTWYHMAFVSNSGTGTFYINGVQDSTGISSTGFTLLGIGEVNIGDNFKGSIDDVRIYNRALSITEISDLYNMGK